MADSGQGSAIGLVGLGNLGLAVAKSLIARGREVVGYRRSSLAEFEAAGGTPAASAADVARRVDLVLTLLRGDGALDDVYLGPEGILKSARPGLVAVELSTIPIRDKLRVKAAADAAGVAMLEGTVSGNPTFIAERTAGIFIGGERALFDRHVLALSDITDQVAWVGPFGAGRVAKFVALYLVSAHNLAAAEALELATRAGLDRRAMFEAIKGSNATSVMLENRGALMVERRYGDYNPEKAELRDAGEAASDPGRGIASRVRQIQRLRDFARALGGRYPLMEAMTETYEATMASGHAHHDIAEVFEYLLADLPPEVAEERLNDLLAELT